MGISVVHESRGDVDKIIEGLKKTITQARQASKAT
jgi:hypothetical protein